MRAGEVAAMARRKAAPQRPAIIKPHVYANLERFGNSAIPARVVEQLGRDAVLDDLRAHGFECELQVFGFKDAIWRSLDLKDADGECMAAAFVTGRTAPGDRPGAQDGREMR